MRNIEGIHYNPHSLKGPKICFTHANGFHPDTYQPLITSLSESHAISAPLLMPFDAEMKPNRLRSWDQFAEEICTYTKRNELGDSIGIGHSMGGVSSLLANAHQKKLFRYLILIEPVILPSFVYKFLKLVPSISLRKKFVPVAKIALNRKDSWTSKEEAKSYLRKKRVFAGIEDMHFDNFIDTTIIESSLKEARLRYSKEWEAQVYATVHDPWPLLKKVKIPTLILRGENSDVILPRTWEKLKKKFDHLKFIEVPETGHLLPLEKPQKVAELILNFVNQR